MRQRFESRIEQIDMNEVWTVIYVPFDVEATFGAKGRLDVSGTIDGVPYQRTLLSDGKGRYFIVTNVTMRKKIGKDAGDWVQVEMEPDETYKEVVLPDYFIEELEEYPDAKAAYEKAPPSSKRWVLQHLTEPKSMDARARRVVKTIEVLQKWYRTRK
jgi:hypothetical protein